RTSPPTAADGGRRLEPRGPRGRRRHRGTRRRGCAPRDRARARARGSRAPSGSRRTGTSRTDQRRAALEEDDVPPDAVQLRRPLADPHLAETGRLVEPDRRLVLGEDARGQRPVARLLGALYELLEQRAAEPGATRLLGNVDAHVADAPVTVAGGG